MWRRIFHHKRPKPDHRPDEFKSLLKYINHLASHKMGYPVSLLTYLGIVDNKILGIQTGSLANVLLNNVGDPFKDSLTSLMEVKEYERRLIVILEKYYGMGLGEARGYVTTGGTEGNFASLWWSKRYLINCGLTSLIKTDDMIKLQIKEEQELVVSLTKVPNYDYQTRATTLQKIINLRDTIAANKNIVQQLLAPTVFYSKANTHYSVPKIAEILRLNMRPLNSNPDGSVDLAHFKKELLISLEAHPFSSVIFVANIGTTLTGAIDNLPEIKRILDSAPKKPIYTIHADGALTGFVLPILQPFGAKVTNYFDQLGINTLAVSAHKYPGLSQPCGIVLATKHFFERAFEKSERSIEYVGDILDVTITGSRSGLNVLMFYNALCSFGLDKNTDELKKMVEANLNNAQYLYERLVKIFGPENVNYPYHFNVQFPKPSMEMARKYQLMLTGGKATICVLTNVTRKLIDQFIEDIKLDKERSMNNTKTEQTIQTLQEQHIKSAVDLFVKTFCNNEPITKHLNMQRSDYEPFAKEVVQKAVKEGLSTVVIDGESRVIACIIAEDIATPFKPNLAQYPKLKTIMGLINTLSKPFLQGKTFAKGKVTHFWMAAVDQELMGHGLFKKLNAETIKMAASRGFNFVYAEFTNEISEKITSQFDVIELCNRINYEDFKMDNQTPFHGLKGAASSYVAAIKPGIKLDTLANCYMTETVTH